MIPTTRGTGWLCVLALVALVAPAGAQPRDSARISGTITDAQAAVVPGVTVTAVNLASGREVFAVTDGQGRYTIDGLAAGSYRVTARLAGFSESGRSLTVAAGAAEAADFALSLGGLSEAITVTAAKGQRATAEINQIVTLVSAENIESRRPQGTQEAFERAPNVRAIDTNPYRARPQFRGFSNSRVLLVVDGERLNNGRYDVAASGVTPSSIDVSQIQSIEVVGGAASSLYGSDAVAGTINIITKTATRPVSGRTLDVTSNLDFNGNSSFTRGNLAAAFATPRFAIRGAFARFNQPSYKSGGEAIDRADVARLGQFIADGGALVGRAVASTYAVYDLPSGGTVINGGAKGYTYNVDASFFPTEQHVLRVRWLQNGFDDLGQPLSQPPFDTFYRFNEFADFGKLSASYEVRELTPWLPRLKLSGYRQRLERPQNDISYTIPQGTSYIGNTLTGNPSQFLLASDTTTLNDIVSRGFDLQANAQPLRWVQYTTGVNYTKDSSEDTFTRRTFSATGATLVSQRDVKTTPDTDYRNLGWYNQLEVQPVRYVKLSGGFRVDNWRTEGKPSPGFPAGAEFAIIQAALPQIQANPGSLNVSGIEGVDRLAAGQSSLETDVTTTTGNVGLTVLLPGGVNPFFRYATSFREPEITVRYLVRDFGSPVFSVQSLPNTTVKPERGKNIDTGVKIDRERVRVQVGFFRNELTNAVANVFGTYCIPNNPAAGLLPTPFPPCSFTGNHAVQFFQRINVPGAVIVKGVETAAEVAIPIGTVGSLNPFVSLGWQKGTQSVANATQTQLMNAFYNRNDTPVKLEGTPDDAPYGELPAWSGTAAVKYAEARNRWWAEYEYRWSSRITRVDPDLVFSVNFPLYGSLKSLEGYDKHTIRAGYDLNPRIPLKLTLGLENLTNSTYFLPFQNGPSPGFSLLLGATVNWKLAF
jgi:outer membrane receptor protein involved in Fe transport